MADMNRGARAVTRAFCPDVPHWQGSLVECLATREPELSPGCRPAWIEADYDYEVIKSGAMFESTCGPEGARLCPGRRLRGDLSLCFDAKKEELTKGCRVALEIGFKAAETREKAKKVRPALPR